MKVNKLIRAFTKNEYVKRHLNARQRASVIEACKKLLPNDVTFSDIEQIIPSLIKIIDPSISTCKRTIINIYLKKYLRDIMRNKKKCI